MFPAERDEQGGLSYEVCVQDGVLRRKSQDVFPYQMCATIHFPWPVKTLVEQ